MTSHEEVPCLKQQCHLDVLPRLGNGLVRLRGGYLHGHRGQFPNTFDGIRKTTLESLASIWRNLSRVSSFLGWFGRKSMKAAMKLPGLRLRARLQQRPSPMVRLTDGAATRL